MITLKNVSKRFGRVQALDGVSLVIEPGERVALVGSNGSGKTTLLRALCGLLQVTGSIEVDGFELSRAPERALGRIAYLPQVAPPLAAPVSELVRAYCALRGSSPAHVAELAARLGLELAALQRTRVRDLSGGMKQKLLAALALSSDAPVLVCDEPTASLDAHARAAFVELVTARAEPSTMVLCSHRADEVRHLVDRVVELQEGRVVSDAGVVEVLGRLRVCEIELSLDDDALRDTDARELESWGFRRCGAARLSGCFPQAVKVELVGRLVASYGARLRALSVRDADSLHQPAAPMQIARRAS